VGDSANPQWGYIDKTGFFVIQPRFRSGVQFSEGLANVNEVGARGFIDRTGEFVIKLPDDLIAIGSFSDGLARVTLQGGIGFIDRRGNVVIKREHAVG